MIGTPNGYLSFSAEMIAAVVRHQQGVTDNPDYLEVDWSEIYDETGDFRFEDFEVRDVLTRRPKKKEPEPTALEKFNDRTFGCCFGGFLILLLVALLVGIGTIIFWIVRLLGVGL